MNELMADRVRELRRLGEHAGAGRRLPRRSAWREFMRRGQLG
jgi:hypothetical protein